ncbi:MAG: GrpB family protein, partial [Propionicimonas sp.]
MIGLRIGTVRMSRYDPKWPAAFVTEKASLEAALEPLRPSDQLGQGDVRVLIEHVGSTSVVSLVAKPIIDIVIGFRTTNDVSRGLALLAKSGRSYVKGANQPGMLFMASGPEGSRSFHYHLVVVGTPAWRRLIVFRDYLRRHPGVAREYGELKSRLAQEYPKSRADYQIHKAPALRAIMQRGFAEDQRRRQAAATRLAAQLADEEVALRAWWALGKGRAPWEPRTGDTADAVSVVHGGDAPSSVWEPIDDGGIDLE